MGVVGWKPPYGNFEGTSSELAVKACPGLPVIGDMRSNLGGTTKTRPMGSGLFLFPLPVILSHKVTWRSRG